MDPKSVARFIYVAVALMAVAMVVYIVYVAVQ